MSHVAGQWLGPCRSHRALQCRKPARAIISLHWEQRARRPLLDFAHGVEYACRWNKLKSRIRAPQYLGLIRGTLQISCSIRQSSGEVGRAVRRSSPHVEADVV